MRLSLPAVFLLLSLGTAAGQQPMTLEQAIRMAVASNPRIGEAAANRRAVDQELRQVQGGLLPQVRVQAEYGNERSRRAIASAAAGANEWRKAGGEAGIIVNQLLFDGFATLNQIYRQMARSDAAAWRTFERAELVALDTAEAFLDIQRFTASASLAAENVAVHERLAHTISQRFSGGRAGMGDQEQVNERLSAARAVLAEFRIRLEEARAAFRKSVGIAPGNLAGPLRLSGLPATRQKAFDLTIAANPTLLAATSDVTAAERDYDATTGLFLPRVGLEGRAVSGRDSSQTRGRFDETSVKLRADWLLFSGGTDTARRTELGERVAESRSRVDSLRRAAFESIDRAWGVRQFSGARIASLQGQVRAAQAVVTAYRGEYELGQRSLLDLLNAENAHFNARLSLEAARNVAVFADYQLLATTGQLLARLNIAQPRDASPTSKDARSVFPTSFGNPFKGALH
ncbi:MAG: TolC family outer membrane protein [Beijerinckiaceae bacterium]|nr:TolC family outer membrane protein [Beijerinckiaceae bacterium]